VHGAILPSGLCWPPPAARAYGWPSASHKRLGSPYRSGQSGDWIKINNPDAPAVKRIAEQDWSK
jgi:hypothetical protein